MDYSIRMVAEEKQNTRRNNPVPLGRLETVKRLYAPYCHYGASKVHFEEIKTRSLMR